MSLIPKVHDLAVQLLILPNLAFYLLILLFNLHLLAVHLCEIGSEANLALQVPDLSIFALDIATQIIKLT